MGRNLQYACIAVIVGKDKVKYYVSGNIKINGIDFNSGDHDYSRLKKLLDKNNILDYRVKSNDGWNFYAVFLYSDGTMKIGSGNDNGFNEYEDNTFETHANNWKNRTDKSSIEK